MLWSRRIVHHDIWDYDTDAAPTLVDVHKDGKTISALVQTTKLGFIFALNRLTGEPSCPIDERGPPYGFCLRNFLNRWGMCWAPPYGTMSAYDRKTGEMLRRKPFGQVQKWGFYRPECLGFGHHRRPPS